MSYAPVHGWHFHDEPAATRMGTWSIRLVGGGLAVTTVLVVLVAATDVRADVGPVSLVGLLAFCGLVTVIAGGVLALVALLRGGERSVYVLATLPLWVFALFLVIGELAASH